MGPKKAEPASRRLNDVEGLGMEVPDHHLLLLPHLLLRLLLLPT
jgi:hypothetical protein